jgi:hypothetical protein
MQVRGAVRVIPRSAVTVAIENQGFPMAYGVVANISENGACLWTNGAFAVGENLVIAELPHEPQPLQAAGRVAREDGQRDEKGDAPGPALVARDGPAHLHLKSWLTAQPT